MLSTDTPEELYRLLMEGRQARSLAPGEMIFDEGDAAEGMFIVGEGVVALKHQDELVVKVEAPGLFGELALIDNEPRSLSAVAETDVSLFYIPVRHFWVLVHETPYFAQLVMSVMARRLRSVGATT